MIFLYWDKMTRTANAPPEFIQESSVCEKGSVSAENQLKLNLFDGHRTM